MYIYIYVYIYMYVYIYVYIYGNKNPVTHVCNLKFKKKVRKCAVYTVGNFIFLVLVHDRFQRTELTRYKIWPA